MALLSPENLGIRGALLGVVEHSGDHVVSAGRLPAAEHHAHVERLVEDIGVPSGDQLNPGPAVGAGEERLDAVCSRDAGIYTQRKESRDSEGGQNVDFVKANDGRRAACLCVI